MKKYRIKQIGNIFIPQVNKGDFLFSYWHGIDMNLKTWYKEDYQLDDCSYNTIEEAGKVIKQYKEKNNKLIKYHY